jgi:hypothetical protein
LQVHLATQLVQKSYTLPLPALQTFLVPSSGKHWLSLTTPFQQGSLEQTEAMGVICAVRHLSDFTALLACRLQMQITVVEADSVKNLFSVG